jgi:surface carbohydrate biosynthesis protein
VNASTSYVNHQLMTNTRVTPEQLWQIITQPMNDVQQRSVGESCATIASQNPDNPDALALLGFYRARIGQYAEALQPLERAQNIDQQHAPTLHALALSYAGLGRHADAEPLLRALLTQDSAKGELSVSSKNIDLVSALATTALNLGRNQEAQALYAAVIDVTSALLANKSAANVADELMPEHLPNRSVHNLLYLPVEVSARELDAKLLIAAFAACKEMDVVVGASSILTRYGFSDLPPGVVLFKTFNAIDASIMSSAIKKNHLIAVIDEEAVGRASTESVYRYNVDPKAAAFADLILTQSEEQRRVMERIYPNTAQKLHTTGNPKTDIFDLEFDEPEAGAEQNGPIIFCLMSGNINPNGRSFAACAESTLSLSGISINSDLGREFVTLFKNCVSYEIAMVPQITEAVRSVAVCFPRRNIVVRPHPVESPSFWSNAFSEFPNITIRADGALTDSLSDAAALIYISGSTTGVEGYLSGVPTIRFVGDGKVPDPANGFSSHINPPARTGDDTVNILKSIFASGAANATKEADARTVSRFFYKPPGTLVSANVAGELYSLLQRHHIVNDSPIEDLRNYNEKRPEPFRPLEFHFGKFPDMNVEHFTQRLNRLAAKAGITKTFDVEKLELNTFLVRAV